MRIVVLKTVLVMSMLAGTAFGGGVYTYTDESGVRVLTNLGASRRVETTEEILPVSSGGNYADLIRETSSKFGVDEGLVSAIIKVESAFDAKAVSSKNCKGLMQLHPDTATRFGVKDIFDPAQNIEGGVRYLTYLMSTFDRNLDYVLAAYNAGENAVRRHNGIPPYNETRQYVEKVKAEFGQTLEPPPPAKRPSRIMRIITADGQVLLTNDPSGT